MSNISVLNNVDHADLKIAVSGGVTEQVNRCQIYASEINELQKEYPILIYRGDEEAALQLHAILGLSKDENLFIGDNGWTTRYVPALLARGPFSIGYSKNDNGEPVDPKICIDMDDERVNSATGEAVFMPMGGESEYLQYVKKALQTIESGAQYNHTLFTLIEEMELLEPVSIQLKLSNVEQVNLNNYYTINQQKLSSLAGDQLSKLSQYGMLGPLYFILSSMGNFQRLIELKNANSAML
ncbi:SapC family protein [Alteromonas lipolytica]|uniref:Peptide ABC transporter permease n=1 Tax=Alteromonas lipolytica TaxID=1856405 RepID=A0A1E8FJA0_9ALTE|nr:SapC family protein [Alteromonas lipolytica]OFI35826.1 peptide ABC transporter permease [Alteromonas lipolytica]GGF81170.1 SapC family protein [Alteromonas lipolytica]